MTVPPFKVAYSKGDAKTLYSNLFDSEQEARDFAAKMENEGSEVLIMQAMRQPVNGDEIQFYQWKLLPGGASFKYRLGMLVTSTKFVVPLGLAVVAYLLLRRNSGLPKVVG
jgi:hypothetical protein